MQKYDIFYVFDMTLVKVC